MADNILSASEVWAHLTNTNKESIRKATTSNKTGRRQILKTELDADRAIIGAGLKKVINEIYDDFFTSLDQDPIATTSLIGKNKAKIKDEYSNMLKQQQKETKEANKIISNLVQGRNNLNASIAQGIQDGILNATEQRKEHDYSKGTEFIGKNKDKIKDEYSEMLKNAEKETELIKKNEEALKKAKQEEIIKKARKEQEKLNKSLQEVGTALTQSLTIPIMAAVAAGLQFNSLMEQTKVNLGTLLGSQSQGNNLSNDIMDMALKTPLNVTNVQRAATTLLAFDADPSMEEVIPSLKQIGDVALGNNERFQRLSLAFAQTQAAGRLMGQDLLQYVNAGFNPLSEISKNTGLSLEYLREQMKLGSISADMIATAFKSATEEGGRFFNGSSRASQTLTGKLQILGEQTSKTFGTIMEPLFNDLKDGILPDLINAVKGVEMWFKSLEPSTKRAVVNIGLVLAAAGPILLVGGQLIKFAASFKTALLALIPALTSTGAAGTAMGVGLSASLGPIGLALALITALVAGITAFNVTKDISKEASYAEALAYESTLDTQKSLAQSYLELKSKAKLTTDEQEQLKNVTEELKTAMPQLTSMIDNQTTSYDKLKQAVNGYINENSQFLKDKAAVAKQELPDVEKQLEKEKKKMELIRNMYENYDKDYKEMGYETPQKMWKDLFFNEIDWEAGKGLFPEKNYLQQTLEALFKVKNPNNKDAIKQMFNDQVDVIKSLEDKEKELLKVIDLGDSVDGSMVTSGNTAADIAKSTGEKYNKMLEELTTTNDKIAKEQRSIMDNIKSIADGFGGLDNMFQRMDRFGTSSASAAMHYMKRYREETVKWSSALNTLGKTLGIDENSEFMSQLRSFGPSSRRLVEGFVEKSKTSSGLAELKGMLKDYGTTQGILYNEANKEYKYKHEGTIKIQFTGTEEQIMQEIYLKIKSELEEDAALDIDKYDNSSSSGVHKSYIVK